MNFSKEKDMDFSNERLGLFNWGLDAQKWLGIDFHLIPPGALLLIDKKLCLCHN